MTSITGAGSDPLDPRLQASNNDDDAALNQAGEQAAQQQMLAAQQAIAAAVGADPDGAELLAEVAGAGAPSSSDLTNMPFDQLLGMVMQGANTHAVADAQSLSDQLNASNIEIGELTSLSGQLNSMSAGLPSSGSVQLSPDVIAKLKADGVSVPDGTTDPATGLVTLTKPQLDALVQNAKAQVQSLSGDQGDLLRKLDSANNVVNELYDLLAKLTSTIKDADAGVLQQS